MIDYDFTYLQSDVFFKYLLTYNDDRAKKILTDLITEITGMRITSFNIVNPDIIRSYHDDKEIILDVLVKDERQRQYDIEMQLSRYSATVFARFEYYGTKLYARQLVKGKDYSSIQDTHVIAFILDFYDRDRDCLIANFEFKDQENNDADNKLHLHFIFMRYFEEHKKEVEDMNMTEEMAFLFQTKDVDDILKISRNEGDIIMEAYEKFKEEEDIYTFCIERRREADAMVRAEELRLEHEQGFVEGKQVGFEEGKQEGKQEGFEEGRQLEATRLKELAIRLKQDGRIEELLDATTDSDLQKKLLAEYQL